MRRDGVHDPDERRAAGTLTGLLWIIGGAFGALWYLVPGAELAHVQLVARLGGDEFAVLVSETDEADLARLSQRIVEQRTAELALTAPGFRVTASVGFTLVDGDRGVDELLAAADRELRRAKRDGKDRWAA